MSVTARVSELAESYWQLSDEERRSFAELVAPLDRSEHSPEWLAEIRSRADDIDSGKVKLVDGDDFLRRLNAV